MSVLLAREAVNLYDAPETRSALLANLQRTPAVVARMYAPGGPSPFGDQSQWIEVSLDGGTVAIGDSGRVIEFFDMVRRSPIGAFTADAGTRRGTFSPDGETLAIVTTDDAIVLADAETRTERARASSEGSHVDAIGYTSDGATLVTAETSGHGTFLVPRDPNTLDPSGSRVRAHDANVTGLAFSADGRWLVTTSQGSDETVLWDARTLRQVRSFDVAARDTPLDAAANDVAVSPDGAVAALIHNVAGPERSEGDVSFLDLRAGDVQVGSGGHRGKGDTQWEATGVAFTPDGRSVVTTGNDSRVLVWDVASARVRETLGGSADVQIRGPAIPSDGTTVFTTDRAREVVVWDLAGDHRMDRPFVAGTGYAGWPWYAASPDGRTLAIMETDDWGRSGSVNLVDTASLTSMGRIRYPHSTPQGVDFGPDGRTLAVSSWNNDAAQSHVRLWNPFAREPKGPDLPGVEAFPDGGAVWATEFSPDGSTLAGGSKIGAGRGRGRLPGTLHQGHPFRASADSQRR